MDDFLLDPVTQTGMQGVAGIVGNLNAEADRQVQLAAIGAANERSKAELDAAATMQQARVKADMDMAQKQMDFASTEQGQAVAEENRRRQEDQAFAAEQAEQDRAFRAAEDEKQRKYSDAQYEKLKSAQDEKERGRIAYELAIAQGKKGEAEAAKVEYVRLTGVVAEHQKKINALAFLTEAQKDTAAGIGKSIATDLDAVAEAETAVSGKIITSIEEAVSKTLSDTLDDPNAYKRSKMELPAPKAGQKQSVIASKKEMKIPPKMLAMKLLHRTLDVADLSQAGIKSEEARGLLKEYVTHVMNAAWHRKGAMGSGNLAKAVGSIGDSEKLENEKAQATLAKLVDGGLMTPYEVDTVLRALDNAFDAQAATERQEKDVKAKSKEGLDEDDREDINDRVAVLTNAGSIRSFAASSGFAEDVATGASMRSAIDDAMVTYSMVSSPQEFEAFLKKVYGGTLPPREKLESWQKMRQDAIANFQKQAVSYGMEGVTFDTDLVGMGTQEQDALRKAILDRELVGVESSRRTADAEIAALTGLMESYR